MKKLFPFLIIFVLITGGCKEISQEQKQREIQQAESAFRECEAAMKQADKNDPTGFLKLYEIATDDLTYTVEYSEIAGERLRYLLYAKTELWIKTFSAVDLNKFKAYIKRTGIWVSELPSGITSDEQFEEVIFNKLKKIKGDRKETELIEYILTLYNPRDIGKQKGKKTF